MIWPWTTKATRVTVMIIAIMGSRNVSKSEEGFLLGCILGWRTLQHTHTETGKFTYDYEKTNKRVVRKPMYYFSDMTVLTLWK
jgi:hypothetical protein